MDDERLEEGLADGIDDPAYRQSEEQAADSLLRRDTENPHFKSELEIFQGLVGIHFLKPGGGELENARPTPIISPLMTTFFPSMTTKARMRNRGIYNRAVTQDMKNRSLYAISHYIITSLYILQILVAATLTALSAYEKSRPAVLTVLGAVNTVVAGLLAWLTGQKMPTRYRRARDQYREIVRHIEALERRFAQIEYINWPEGQRPDPVLERDRVVQMFEDARKDQEANYPNTTQAPLSDQMSVRNDELKDELWKGKAKKKAQKARLNKLKAELDESRAETKAGLDGGKKIVDEQAQ